MLQLIFASLTSAAYSHHTVANKFSTLISIAAELSLTLRSLVDAIEPCSCDQVSCGAYVRGQKATRARMPFSAGTTPIVLSKENTEAASPCE
jgi:hypothetical protein